ncbi:hypothetical protein DSO57_1021550 [Entomophthora muscae]|uniref:Uncharacterized protein n=1 Tax=Entomophthora muscae TaxID=34485 RepID=A0ACC2T3I7_9FUNG|nr:hypothetical protein DSO57_1021550 [Entomophthora muscae]
MLEIPPTLPLPTVPPAQNFSRASYWDLVFPSYCSQISGQNCAYCVLGLPGPAASPAGVQPDSGMGHDTMAECEFEKAACTTSKWNPFPPTFTSDKLLFAMHLKESQL